MASYYVSGYTPPTGISDKSSVMDIQRQLNAAGASLAVDGIWGPKTQAAYNGSSTGTANAVQSLTSGLGAFMQGIQSLLSVPSLNYAPRSSDSIRSDLEATLRPGVDMAIRDRQEQTLHNRAEIDVDALSRGMGKSTYVTDVKDRQLQYEAQDISDMEAKYSAALGQMLMEALERERERALAVQQFNIQQQDAANKLAFATAQSAYSDYVTQLQAAQQASGSRNSAKSSAKATTASNCYSYLEALTPRERTSIYTGADSKSRAIRDELIASLGESGYLDAQARYPAA